MNMIISNAGVDSSFLGLGAHNLPEKIKDPNKYSRAQI